MKKAYSKETIYGRSKNEWLKITLIDDFFNLIYKLTKDSYLQSTLNSFYDPQSSVGRAIYNDLPYNEHTKSFQDVGVQPVNYYDWINALKARLSLYRYVAKKYIDHNSAKITVKTDCILKYSLGIQSILEDVVVC